MNAREPSRHQRRPGRHRRRFPLTVERLEEIRLLSTINVSVGNTSGVEDGSTAHPYRSIQTAVNNSASGDTVQVAPGTYAEWVTVDRPVAILGPNAGVDPSTGTRGPEATIVPPVNNPNSGRLVLVTASGVTLDGLSIDGNNPALAGGTLLNGVSSSAASGVSNVDPQGKLTPISGLTVRNDSIRDLTAFGVIADVNDFSGGPLYVSSGNTIAHNRIDNIPVVSPVPGRGISIEDNFYCDVTDNVVTRAGTAIQAIEMLSPPKSGPASVIARNSVQAYALGVYLWNLDTDAPAFVVSDNTVTAPPGGGMTADSAGVELFRVLGSSGVSLSNNNVSGYHTGLELDSVSASPSVVVTGGVLSGNAVGVELSNVRPPSVTTPLPVQAALRGVTVVNSSITGLLVTDALGKSAAPVTLSADAATTATGGPHGAALSGPYARLAETSAPVVTLTGTPPSPSTSPSAVFTFAAADNVSTPNDLAVKYQLDGGPLTACASPLTLTGLTGGPHSLVISATDQAGNVGKASYSWTVTATAPTVTATANPGNLPGNTGTATVTVSGKVTGSSSPITGASFRVVDSSGVVQPSGAVTVNADGSYTLTLSLATNVRRGRKRTYTVTVRARNAADQVGLASAVVTVA